MRVAVIPARGGSKRIPRKNIREFAGKPMIAHSIDCALASGLFERVIVSTDDGEIAAIARQFGAEVPFTRPASLSDDHAGTSEVVAHALGFLIDAGQRPSAACCIYATAPFVRAEDLRKGLRLLEAGGHPFVFSAATYAASVFRAFLSRPDGLEMLFPEHRTTRTQDLPDTLHDAGQFYWGGTQAWLDAVPIFGPGCAVVEIPRWRAVDIDTEEDWVQAQWLALAMAGGANADTGES